MTLTLRCDDDDDDDDGGDGEDNEQQSAFDVLPALVNPPFLAVSSEFQRYIYIYSIYIQDIYVHIWSEQVLASSVCATVSW